LRGLGGLPYSRAIQANSARKLKPRLSLTFLRELSLFGVMVFAWFELVN